MVLTRPNDPALVADLLLTPATWAVVGLSTNAARTAHRIAGWLHRERGMTIIPVHPHAENVFGAPGYARLADIPDAAAPVRVVDLFVNSQLVGGVVDEAIAEKSRLGLQALWFQLDVVDPAAEDRARAAGLAVISHTCPRIEWPDVARRTV